MSAPLTILMRAKIIMSLELILRESEDIVVREGDYYFREGEPGDSLFVLESGTVLVQRLWQGQPIELGRLASGDC